MARDPEPLTREAAPKERDPLLSAGDLLLLPLTFHYSLFTFHYSLFTILRCNEKGRRSRVAALPFGMDAGEGDQKPMLTPKLRTRWFM